MNKKIFITGLPRSGTTMLLFMCTYFNDVHVYTSREVHPFQFFNQSIKNFPRTMAKEPYGLYHTTGREYTFKQMIERNYKIIVCLRDPRDVLVSKHKNDMSRYWVEPVWIERCLNDLLPLKEHPNIIIIKYEDLVLNPKVEMERLSQFLGLTLREGYLNFHTHPDTKKWNSLGQIRAVEPSRVKNWQNPEHAERLKKDLNSRIISLMKEFGYV